MKHAKTIRCPTFQVLRFILIAELVLFVPQTSLIFESRSEADDKSDQDKMQGKWKIVRCEYSGRDDSSIVGVEDTITDARWKRPKRTTSEYQLKFNTSHDPKWVDLMAERLGDETLKGIYKLEGDKLTICYAYDPASPRPTEFKTTSDVKGYLYVLERVKEN
jgi:uncharacterized protein (TIGR03067 family)